LGVELSGTQKCLSTCVWGECVRDVYECEGDKPSSRCGPCGVGIQNYTCDSSNGQWVKSGECKVAEAAEYCEPKQASGEPTIRDCVLTEQKAPGAQLCNEDCTWGPCISLDIECKGDAPPGVTPCGVCGKRLFTCDRTTGTWVESTSCAEPTVECNPKAIPAPSMSCVVGGSAGYRSCTSECTWGKCVTIN
jgi:hypothetical protein